MIGAILNPQLKRNKKFKIGIFTPSFPAHVKFRKKFDLGIAALQSRGYGIDLGSVTRRFDSNSYRSADSKSRAREFMELIYREDIDILMSTIGGSNSSSLLEYLDYDAIRDSRKVIVGYSDVTSLHMAILSQSGLATCYGPAVVPTYGEWPKPDLSADFFEANIADSSKINLSPPPSWSRTFRDYNDGSWNTKEREYICDNAWKILRPGKITSRIVVCNISTLLCLAGTKYLPCFRSKILFIEDMEVSLAIFERRLTQMKLMGIFDQISGLVFSKIEFPEKNTHYFQYEDILKEICTGSTFPIITNFDCSHTTPMISLFQNCLVELEAHGEARVNILERRVDYID
jgi:muramoyltetrapeptide carboxypeptidase